MAKYQRLWGEQKMSNPYFLLNIFHIIIDGLYESVPLLLSFMSISFGFGEKEVGLIISLAVMVSTLTGLSTKYLSRHFGWLTTLILITTIDGLGFFANAFSFNFVIAGFCFIVAIAGYGVFHNVSFSYLTSVTSRKSLGTTIGNFTAVGDIGRIPFTAFAGFVSASHVLGISGWRIVSLAYGAGTLIFSGWIYCSTLSVKEKTSPNDLLSSDTKKYFPAFSLLRNSKYALPISANIFDAIGSDQFFAFLPFLLFAKKIDPKIIGLFALVFTAGCFLGKMVCGRLVDRFGTHKVFVAADLLMSLLLGILVVATQPFIILGASLLLGFVTKGTIPVVQTIVVEPVEESDKYDDVFTMSTFSRGTTNIITPILFGWIASSYGVIWIYCMMAIAAFCAVLPVLIMNNGNGSRNIFE